MKPTPHTSKFNSRRDSLSGNRSLTSLPKTDFDFQASRLGDFSGRGKGNGKNLPPFRAISENYFKSEARNHFLTEAAFFALIVVTSAVPVFASISGLVRFVYGGL